MYENAIGKYAKIGVGTAEPIKLVIMCYEKFICNIKLAKDCYAEKRYEDKAMYLAKAIEIVHALTQALDFKKGGEVATHLNSLYVYIQKRIIQSDLARDTGALDEVITIMQELLSAWEEIAVNNNKDLSGLAFLRPNTAAPEPMRGHTWSA
jgi:flagellar protein FliS